ncbi:MAG: dCTP deaminase [Chlamydiae bacterium]|nr:dCTP deaminase [Chlamydiota bacterium]
MSIKSDRWIRRKALKDKMIEPFVDTQVALIEDSKDLQTSNTTSSTQLLEHPQTSSKKAISYGLSSYGYDLRVSDKFKVFTNVHNSIVDPKNFQENSFVDIQTDVCIVPPNSFALAVSVEYFRIPKNVLTICLGKSTYARCGIIVNVTPFEPGWEGYVTLEISNTTPLPAKIYANEGLAQVLFFESDEVCEVSYDMRKGKYMKQEGITIPVV